MDELQALGGVQLHVPASWQDHSSEHSQRRSFSDLIDFESSKNPATNKALMASLSEFSLYCRELGTYRAHINQLEVAAPSWSLESLCSVINH